MNKRLLMCYHSSEHGGVEVQILDIIKGLSKDIDIYVVCPNGPLVKEYIKAGAKKHIDLRPNFEFDPFYIINLIKLIRSLDIDIVHAHELYTGVQAMFAAFMVNVKKRIYHVHTPFIYWKQPGYKKQYALFINTLANFFAGNFFATDVIALTDHIKRIRMQKEHIFRSKIRVIPNGVDLNKLTFDKKNREIFRQKLDIKNEILIGNLSRFTKEKGHEDLIIAFSKLIYEHKFKNIKLFLGGYGELFEETKILAKTYKVYDYIIFYGKFEDDLKATILSSFDVFVFPSHAEGFGIVLIEAMAVGIPCLASNLDVLKDVGGSFVKYFKVSDTSDLALNLYEMIKDSKSLEKMSIRAKEKVKDYKIEKFWDNYKKLYLSI